jgi:hypothetical protein
VSTQRQNIQNIKHRHKVDPVITCIIATLPATNCFCACVISCNCSGCGKSVKGARKDHVSRGFQQRVLLRPTVRHPFWKHRPGFATFLLSRFQSFASVNTDTREVWPPQFQSCILLKSVFNSPCHHHIFTQERDTRPNLDLYGAKQPRLHSGLSQNKNAQKRSM